MGLTNFSRDCVVAFLFSFCALFFVRRLQGKVVILKLFLDGRYAFISFSTNGAAAALSIFSSVISFSNSIGSLDSDAQASFLDTSNLSLSSEMFRGVHSSKSSCTQAVSLASSFSCPGFSHSGQFIFDLLLRNLEIFSDEFVERYHIASILLHEMFVVIHQQRSI